MKKIILSAFCLGLVFATANALAAAESQLYVTKMTTTDGRQPVKPEELPDAIKKTLASDAYKGWTVKEAALVTIVTTQAATSTTAATSAAETKDLTTSYYEVILIKEKEVSTLKFQKDGAIMK